MRYTILILAIQLALLIIAPTAAGATTPVTDSSVTVANYTLDPPIFISGDKGTLTVTIINRDTTSSETTTTSTTTTTGSTSTTSISLIKTKIDDVRLYSRNIESVGEDGKRVIYDNPGALSPGESMTLTFPLEADVEDGTYFPELRITVEDGINTRYPIPITVDSSPVEIIPIDIPGEIPVKGSQLIQLAVANTRQNSVESVRITPRSSIFKFAPESIFIGRMAQNEEVNANFTLTPLIDGAGVDTISFRLDYRNGDNTHVSTLEKRVEVVEREDLRVIVVSYPQSIPVGGTGRVELDIANGRSSDLSSVRVVPITDGFTLSPKEVFMGDMEQDDVFSAEFDLRPVSGPGTFEEVSFRAIYRDLGNDKLYETEPITLTIEIGEEEKESPALSPIALLLGFVIAVRLISRTRQHS